MKPSKRGTTHRFRCLMAVLAVASLSCSSADDASTVSSAPSEATATKADPTATSHMMGMSTGPDPEPAEVDASPYVFAILPDGAMALDRGVEREVSVIAQGEPTQDGAVPLVVRNMTRDTVHMVQGHVDLLDDNDQVLDSGDFAFLAPFAVAPGEIAFGAMPTGDDWDLAAGTLRAKVDSFNVMAPGPEARSMAVVTEASLGDGVVTGTATNDTEAVLAGGVEVTAMCFDTIRRPAGVVTVAVEGDVPAGGSVEFEVPLDGGGAPCTRVLLTATEMG